MQLLRDEAADYEAVLATSAALADDEQPSRADDRERKKELVAQAMDRFKLIVEIEGDQRDREVEDLEFDRALPEDQWPEDVRKARTGGIAPDGSVIHARPCLVIPKLDQPVQQVINEARKARLGIIIKPKGNGANKAGAELRQGMIRAIEQDSRANIARIWALERAVKCGRGAYRILKTHANDGDFDMDLVVQRIKNQGCVYLDPYAQEPDWSDGEYAFITDDMPVKEYKRLYGKSALASMSAEELQSVSDVSPGWVTDDGKDTGTIRVAEYFYVEYEPRTLILNPETGKNELLEKGAAMPTGVTVSRTVQKRQVKWAVINATEVLDEEEWEGRFIPIIPVIGKEYNVDGEAAWKGVVSNAKDAQRLYNYARSSQALRSGLESLAPWVMAEGQDEGYEQMWDEANTRAFTRLKYKPTTFEGHLVPPPQRNDLSSTNISASVLMAREADMDIQATTGRFNPSLGKQDSNQRSGKAIAALKQQGEQSSSNYLENLANISMVYEGRVLLDLLKYVYDRPGRVVRLLGDDPKDEREVLLKQPFIAGPDGRPVSAEPNTPGLIPALMQKMRGKKPLEKPTLYTLDDGDYTVAVTIGQAFATQQEAQKAFVLGVIQAAPNLAPYLIDIAADLEGTDIGKRVKDRLAKINPQLKDEAEDGPAEIPPEVQQQMAMLQQQNQALQQELAKAKSGLPAEEMRVQSNERIKQLEIASRERIEAAKIRAGVTTKQAELGSKEGIAAMEDQTKRATKAADLVHDDRKQTIDIAREEHAASRDEGREERSALRNAAHEDRAARRDAAHEDHAAVRDASLQPAYPPVKGEDEFTAPDSSPV